MIDTRVLPFNDAAIGRAASMILGGGIVAVPTETVYGLAADATNGEAVARIYEAKGRPQFNPLIVHVPDLTAALAIGDFNDEALDLAHRHWPGSLTLVVPLKQGAGVNALVTAGLPNIAIRVPNHPAMQELLAAVARPLAAPSANASGSISPTRADHVLRSLGGRIPLIIDGGASKRGIESTIIAATGNGLRLLRRGPIEVDAAESSNGSIEAPGQLASHYAPSKPLRRHAVQAVETEFMIGFGAVDGDVNLSPAGDLVEAAARLFEYLHQADESSKAGIAVAPIPDEGIGAAINDRFGRAAAPR